MYDFFFFYNKFATGYMSSAEWEQNSVILPGAFFCVTSRFKIKLHHMKKLIQPREDFHFASFAQI